MLKLVRSSLKNTVFPGGFFVSALSLPQIKCYTIFHLLSKITVSLNSLIAVNLLLTEKSV